MTRQPLIVAELTTRTATARWLTLGLGDATR
jgi:hypothetical protein